MIDCCSKLRMSSGNKLKVYNDVKFKKFSDHIELYSDDSPIIKLYKHGRGIVIVKENNSMRLIPSSMAFSMDFEEVVPEFLNLFINDGYCINRKCKGLNNSFKDLYYADKLNIGYDINSLVKKYL